MMFLDKEKQAKIKETLNFRNGCGKLYKFPVSGNLYTEGIKEMAKLCQADWLVTDTLVICKYLGKRHPFIVVSFMYTPKLADEGIQAKVTYEDGNATVIHTDMITVTNFPLETFKMFYENNTLYLPSER